MMTARKCPDCKGTGRRFYGECVDCGGDGLAPTYRMINTYAWRKAGRQIEPVTVADAMRHFKCDREKIIRLVGFLEGTDGDASHPKNDSPYFYIIGAPDLPADKLEFEFDGE